MSTQHELFVVQSAGNIGGGRGGEPPRRDRRRRPR